MEEREQIKMKLIRRKEIMKIRKAIESKKLIEKKSVKPKSGSLKRSIKLVNFSLSRLTKKIRKMQITNIRNKREVITSNPMHIRRIIKEYYCDV